MSEDLMDICKVPNRTALWQCDACTLALKVVCLSQLRATCFLVLFPDRIFRYFFCRLAPLLKMLKKNIVLITQYDYQSFCNYMQSEERKTTEDYSRQSSPEPVAETVIFWD